MPTKVTVAGQVFLTDDLTIEEAERVEDITGDSWLSINPLRSAKHCKAIMLAFAQRSMDEKAAAKLIGSLTVREALDAVEVVTDEMGEPHEEADLPASWSDGMPDPKVGAAPSTSGSSGAGETSSGPLT